MSDETPQADPVPAWLDALPPVEPERYRLDLVLPAEVYRQLAALATLRGAAVEQLAADLVAEGVARLRASEGSADPYDNPRAAQLAAMVNELTAEVAELRHQQAQAEAERDAAGIVADGLRLELGRVRAEAQRLADLVARIGGAPPPRA